MTTREFERDNILASKGEPEFSFSFFCLLFLSILALFFPIILVFNSLILILKLLYTQNKN